MPASTTTSPLYWDLRSRLSPSARGTVRRATDSLLAPLGSIRGARTVERVVALTFDDGPDPNGTPAVLAALRSAGVTATFFLLVERAEAAPELARQIVADGHEVGLHGLDHTRLTTLDPAAVAGLLRDARRRLEAILARPVRLFRPPYGAQTLRTYLAARRAGLRVVVWSADAEDWVDQEARQVADRALSGVTPGGVLLLHDAWHQAGVPGADDARGPGAPGFDRGEVVDRLLAGLGELGYQAMAVAALTDGRRTHRTAWFRP